MQRSKAKVTTVIPVFNGEAFLQSTLESVAQQERRPDRLIVQDNCSTDGTRQLVQAFSGMPCEWRQNEKNIGLTGNLNRALELAPETEHLHILLADDRIKPAFFAKILPPLEAFAGRAIGYCPYELINEKGERVPPLMSDVDQAPRRIALHNFLAAQAELRTILIPAVVLKTNYRPSPCQLPWDMPQVGDSLFYARWGAAADGIVEIPQPLCQYRIHSAQTTTKNMLNINAWVLDEWRVMDAVAAEIKEPALSAWLRRQKLKCLFAARSHVKIGQMHATQPAYAAEIRSVARGKVPGFHWSLAGAVVRLRDTFYRLIARDRRLIA